MGLSELCIRRPVLTTLVTATFLVFGAFAYRLLPVAALPAVDFPTISVTATLPGASAEVVLAQQMSQVPGVALVDVYGSQKFAVRVQVDPVAAAARNISLDDIRRVIVSTNSNSPVGTLYGPQQNVTLLATAAMRHAAE